MTPIEKSTIPPPPSASSPGAGPHAPFNLAERTGELALWFDGCEAELVNPSVVEDRLRRSGWPAGPALDAATTYRRRFNEHPLGYTALLVTTGLTALGAGTVGHLLTAGFAGPVQRDLLGTWAAIFVCAFPFAIWSHVWARRVDRIDAVAVWSRPRRILAQILLWAAGIVGVARLVTYTAQLIGVIVGATWAANASVLEGAVNVVITVTIALPLGLWAYRFLHRFDGEDPTRPTLRTRGSVNRARDGKS